MEFLVSSVFWFDLLYVTALQLVLGADNLIIISILANKLPEKQRPLAIRIGLIIAMFFRIALLMGISVLLRMSTKTWFESSSSWLQGTYTLESLIFLVGGLVLTVKGVHHIKEKLNGGEHEKKQGSNKFSTVIATIVGINLLFSMDSIFTVVGMTSSFPVMIGSVVISVVVMLLFASQIASFIARKPDFEVLGIFFMILIGFCLILHGAHLAHTVLLGNVIHAIPQSFLMVFMALVFIIEFIQDKIRTNKEKVKPVGLHRKYKSDTTSAE